MYDVFISYRREGGIDFARLLYEELTKRGLSVFFDIEELREGNFNNQLYSAILNSKNFIVIMSRQSLDRCVNENDWVNNEIKYALDEKINIIPIMMEEFQFPDKLGNIEAIRHIQAVQYIHLYHNASIEKICERLQDISWNNIPKGEIVETIEEERFENTYINNDNHDKELARLNTQRKILKRFDIDVYEKIKEELDNLVILDIGTNRGDLIIDRFGNAESLEKIMGLEFDEKIVDEANKKYKIPGKIHFYNANVEANDFEEKLKNYMLEMKIESFNVIHISMLLLHLKKPFNLLKVVRKYLSKDGVLFIRDIDDGLNIAYPDEKSDFKRVVDMCNILDTSGYRHCGREIYTLLKRTGYKNVVLEKNGLSTIEMNFEAREALFDTYFSFVLEDAEIMMNRHPENETAKENYEWLKNNYENLEERFLDSNFYFNLGFMTFTAKK